jgi:hypothetical protein
MLPPIELSEGEDDAQWRITSGALPSSRTPDAYLLEDGCLALVKVDESGDAACHFFYGGQGQPCTK